MTRAPNPALANPTAVAQGLGTGALAAQLPARALPSRASKRDRRAARQAEDLRLVAAIGHGDDDAFTRLVEKYQRPLYWLAYDILLDADEARDVVQETFVRVHAALHRYDRKRPFVNWIYRIARNLSIDLHRRRVRRASHVDDLGHVSNEASRSPAIRETGAKAQHRDMQAQVQEVLATLPPEYRVVLTLREMHTMTPREIADVTDCSYATARWRLHRARNLFRKAWNERYATPGTPPEESDPVAGESTA